MRERDGCPICTGRRWRTLCRRGLDFQGERVRFCVRCGGVFLSPHMDEAEAAGYYRAEYSRRYRGGERPDAAAMARRHRVATERFARLRDRLRGRGRYLEIGCGAGNFLAKLVSRGYRAVGIEPAAGYAASGRERGLDIRTGTFPGAVEPLARYDGICLFHVLEHIAEPDPFLAALVGRLRPGGWVAVEVPDLLAALAGKFRHRYFHRPHVIDFHRRTLACLLARHGLAVESATLGSPARPHHLLVVARPRPVEPDWPGAHELEAWWRQLSRRVLVSRTLGPLSRRRRT